MRKYIRIDLTGRLCCHVLTLSDPMGIYSIFFRSYDAYAGNSFFSMALLLLSCISTRWTLMMPNGMDSCISIHRYLCVCVCVLGKFHRSDQLIVLKMQERERKKKNNKRTFIDVAAWNLTENHEQQQHRQQQKKEHEIGMGGTSDWKNNVTILVWAMDGWRFTLFSIHQTTIKLKRW